MIFNKTNFRIYSLAEKEARYHLNGIHVTPDYTEVTNGHYLIRVDAPYKGKRKEALKDCPIVNKQAPVTRECEFVIPTEAAREIEKNIPKERGLTQRTKKKRQPFSPLIYKQQNRLHFAKLVKSSLTPTPS